jgi:ABC-type dipeptide/oligopeptide/nickel transport system permease component
VTTAAAAPLPAAGAGAPRRVDRAHAAALALAAARRIAGAVSVIFSVVTVTFVVTRVFAPDPTSLYLGAAGNGFASPEAEAVARAKVQKSLGLDGSLLHQYGRYLSHVVRGDLGNSFTTGRSVTSDLISRFPATAELAVYSLILGLSVGIIGGVLAAVRHERWFDRISRFFAIGFMAMPQFWIGLMLLWLFFTQLHMTPGPVGRLPVGTTPPDHITGFYVIDALLTGALATAWQAISALALPVITLGLGLAAPVFKVVRTSMLEALTSDYVRTAGALGFGRRRIWFAYALKNGLLPLVTILAGIIGYTFAGSVLVEGIFSWPGVGNYAYSAIQNSDFPAIQGFVLYSAVLYVVVYEVMNALYAVVDPRVRS